MKFTLLGSLLSFLFALSAVQFGFCDKPLKLTAGTLNDNYTGNVESGKSGRYLGADDFLTFSFLARVSYGIYHSALIYNIITSRKDNFRYDLLTLNNSRDIRWKQYYLTPGVEISGKGNLLGNKIQNGFHSLKDLPELDLPYDDFSMGGGVTFNAGRYFSAIIFKEDRLQPELESRLSWPLLPSKLGLNLSYLVSWKRVKLEPIIGYRIYFTEAEHYSNMLRNGFLYGAGAGLRCWKSIYFNSGLILFPADNLENDPLYQDKNWDNSYQIWVMISTGSKFQTIREFIGFF